VLRHFRKRAFGFFITQAQPKCLTWPQRANFISLRTICTSKPTAPTTIPVSIIRKITFVENTLGVAATADDRKVVLFPNPSTDFFKISSDYKKALNVKIYSLTGQLVHQGVYANDQNIDVTTLSTGLYVVQVNNSTLKFIKK
jgi:hypothetical protein